MPAVRPTPASTISSDPRTLRIAPSASESEGERPLSRAGTPAPMTLADTATTIASSVHSSTDGAVRSATSTRSPATAKNSGPRNEETIGRSARVTVSPRSAQRVQGEAGDERAEDRIDPEAARHRRHRGDEREPDQRVRLLRNFDRRSRCNSRTVTNDRDREDRQPRPRPSVNAWPAPPRRRDDDAEQHPPHDVVAHRDRHRDVSEFVLG